MKSMDDLVLEYQRLKTAIPQAGILPLLEFAWERAVSKDLVGQTEVQKFDARRGVLQVKVLRDELKYELSMMRVQILEAMNETLRDNMVRDIKWI